MHNRLIKITALAGLMIGSFAFAVMAETYTWTPATTAAPGDNMPAPINVSKNSQSKRGGLQILGESLNNGYALDVNGPGYFTGLTVSGSIVVNSLFVNSADKDKAGYVLTNDGTGKAEWKSVSSAGGGTAGQTLDTSYCYASKASGSYPVGAFKGYYLKGLIKSIGDVQSDGVGRPSVGGVYCLSSGTTDARMTNNIKNTVTTDSRYGPVVFRSIGLSYNDLVNDCNANKSSYGVGNALGIPHDQTSMNVCPALDPF